MGMPDGVNAQANITPNARETGKRLSLQIKLKDGESLANVLTDVEKLGEVISASVGPYYEGDYLY